MVSGLLTDLERVAIYLALLELEFLAQIVQLRLRRADLRARVRKHLLSILQVVAGDEVLDIRDEHQEKRIKRDRAHHVGVGRPEALFAAGVRRTLSGA